MGELGGTTKDQHLIVVFTKADQLLRRFKSGWKDLQSYLVQGSIESLARPEGYIQRMQSVSDRLLEFTENELNAYEFVNAAQSNFKSINFSIISALGTEPEGARLSVAIVPRRILDPVLWIMEKSADQSLWSRLFSLDWWGY
jgi:hypothetical protein